jgi:carbon-monoxide dehydrogenase large subunit
MTPYKYIGKSRLRKEDRRFLSGTGKYVGDVHLPNMVYAAVLRSPQAHARIREIRTDVARSLPGVLGVFCAEDFGEMKRIPMRLAPREGLRGCFQTPIATDCVRYVGEPLALVIATSRYIAEDALELIETDLEGLPIIADVDQGRAADVAFIHPSLGSNVAERIVMRVGDPETAMAEAPVRIRGNFKIQRHTGVPLETRGLLAAFDVGADMLTVWGAAKVPHFNRQILADLLDRPENKIRLIETDVGGGFGPRGEFYPEDFLVPWAAMKVGRPVQWIEDRREHLMATNHSREQQHEIEVGADRDGTIRAIRLRGAVDMGAYIRTNGFVVPERSAAFIPGPYRVPNYLAEVDCVMTNKTPTGSYRGPGRYEAAFVRERAIDLLAQELKLDPADVRRKNLIRPQEMPYNAGTKAFGHDVIYDSGDYPDLFEKALQRADYPSLRADQRRARASGRYVGIGLCAFVEKSGVGPWETGRVRIDGSGHVEVHTGVASVGQGMETVLAQICAEQLDLSPDLITVRHGDTALIPLGAGAYGSRGTVTGGSALWKAAGQLRQKLLRLAAHRLEVDIGELKLEDGAVFVPGTDLRLNFRELARAAMPGQPMPEGMTPELDESAYFVVKETAHPHGAHIAVVECDIQLGVIKILKYLMAYDIGLAINPLLVEGQMIGGFAQGLGGALLEELVYSPEAQLLTGSFMDYLLPTSAEMPVEIDTLLLQDSPSPHNPLGTKGAGEAGTVGAGAAIANAVADALSPLGIAVNALPLSPNAIFNLIQARHRADDDSNTRKSRTIASGDLNAR